MMPVQLGGFHGPGKPFLCLTSSFTACSMEPSYAMTHDDVDEIGNHDRRFVGCAVSYGGA